MTLKSPLVPRSQLSGITQRLHLTAISDHLLLQLPSLGKEPSGWDSESELIIR